MTTRYLMDLVNSDKVSGKSVVNVFFLDIGVLVRYVTPFWLKMAKVQMLLKCTDLNVKERKTSEDVKLVVATTKWLSIPFYFRPKLRRSENKYL